jgi:hypothetical protein
MLTRFQRGLRLFIAVMALSCGVLGAAEPVAAAPSCYPAALALPTTAQVNASAVKATRGAVTRPVLLQPQLSAAGTGSLPRRAPAPALSRAPRLYLRHCVLLR